MEASKYLAPEFGKCAVANSPRLGEFAYFEPAPLPRRVNMSPETWAALVDAAEALGELNSAGRHLLNADPLTQPYIVHEAWASSQIEGTHASLKEVYEAGVDEHRPAPIDVVAIHRYRRALDVGLREIAGGRLLTVALLTEIHNALLQGGKSVEAGRVRSRPNWVGSSTDRPQTALFVPPATSESLYRALDDLDNFLAFPPDMHPLINCALFHYGFLTAHPYIDGNGRIGRMAILLYLLAHHRLEKPLLYLSSYFLRRRSDYIDQLQAVRETGAVDEWLQFFLAGISEQARDAVKRAERVASLREEYRKQFAGSRSRAVEVVDLLFEDPFVTTARVRDALSVTNQGAIGLIRQLERAGLLVDLGERPGRGSPTWWIAGEVWDIFGNNDAFDDNEDEGFDDVHVAAVSAT